MQQRQRWFGVIALLFLIVIAYADRVNIAVMLVNPDFLQHFQLGGDRAHQGTLMTVFARLRPVRHVADAVSGNADGLPPRADAERGAVGAAHRRLAAGGSLMLLCVVRALLGVSEGRCSR